MLERLAQFRVRRAARPATRVEVGLAVVAGASLELVVVPAAVVLVGTRTDAVPAAPSERRSG